MSYTIEILPYPLRAKGFNIFNLVVSLALIFNQYVSLAFDSFFPPLKHQLRVLPQVNPVALGHLNWKYYVSGGTFVFSTLDSSFPK